MIVCSCNVFSDCDVREALAAATDLPRTPGEVYNCLGCSAQCGRCMQTIRDLLKEAIAASSQELAQ
jgi:bacterioferritin-associated ferredoxin